MSGTSGSTRRIWRYWTLTGTGLHVASRYGRGVGNGKGKGNEPEGCEGSVEGAA